MITEHELAKALRDGLIPSPVQFFNAMFVAMRITATGASWRGPPHEEYCWRDASLWLTDEMCARWQGAPVIVQHPDKGVLDTQEFQNRVIGAAVLPYVKGAELWCIARILDADAAKLISEYGADTSPAVVFASDAPGKKISLRDGATLFVEDNPVLCDHVAVIASGGGVWSKGDAANSGVDTSATGTGVTTT